MKLFSDEVYKNLENQLKEKPLHNGIEDALNMISKDKKLHKWIRKYSERNAITHNNFGEYGNGSDFDFVDRKILIWIDKEKSGKNDERDLLYIGPDPNVKIMPIFLRVWDFDTSEDSMLYENYKILKKDKGYYLENKESHLHNRRITETGIFNDISSKDILSSLEKSILQLIRRKR